MQHSDAEAELSALTSALRAHLEWAESLGTLATPPIDEDWLQARRAQYRALEVANPPLEASPPAEPGVAETRAAQADIAPSQSRSTAVAARDERVLSAQDPLDTLRTQIPGPEAQTPAISSANPAENPRIPHSAPRDITAANLDTNARRPGTSVSPGSSPSPAPAQRATTTQRSPVAAQPPVTRVPMTAPPAREPGAPIVLSSEARSRLTLLEQEVKSCTRCELHTTRTQTVFARGQGSSGLCFVGEGPGADEDLQGSPFVGAAGQLLDRMIAAMGLQRDEVYVCNIVKCRPPQNRKPLPEEADACRSYLDEQLQLMSPRVIVALGATAASGLLDVPLSITRLRGNWRLYRGRVPVMPTFHPSYLLRTPAAKREVWSDLLLVLDQLGLPRPAKDRK